VIGIAEGQESLFPLAGDVPKMPVPCMRSLADQEAEEAYGLDAGKAIVSGSKELGIDSAGWHLVSL
jgi:hypothetical protein